MAVRHAAWYDYYLSGKENYPADRAAAERAIASMPNGVVRTAAVQNRKFLMRAVRHLAVDLGIRQFLDIGSRSAATPRRPVPLS